MSPRSSPFPWTRGRMTRWMCVHAPLRFTSRSNETQTMRKNGNVKSNAYFNPDTKKHPPPVSQEDADSIMERHIRAKYEYKTFQRDAKTTSSPPAARSSAITSGSASFNLSPPSTASSAKSGKPSGFGASKLGMGLFRSSSPGSNAKVNQILGTNGAPYTDRRKSHSGPVTFPHGMASATPLELYGDQIKSLREMGFVNVPQCLEVLQQTDGKMMDAVEILIRLNKAEERRPEPPPKNAAGLTVHKSGPAAVARQRTGGSSSNPFDALDKQAQPLPPLPSVKTGQSVPQMQMTMSMPGQTMPQQMGIQVQNGYPVQTGWNGVPVQTNEYHQQQQQQQQQQSMSPFQMNDLNQSFPTQQPNQFGQIPQQHAVASQFTPTTTGSTTASYNPFMSAIPPANPYQSHMAVSQPNLPLQSQAFNPYAQLQQQQPQQQLQLQQIQQQIQQQQIQQQQIQQQQIQQQQIQQQQQQQQQPLPQLTNNLNPYGVVLSTTVSYPPAQQVSYASQQIPFQRTGIDKSQILALYSAPQLAPPRAQNQVEVVNTPQPPPEPQQQQQPPMPGAGSNNPFLPPAPAGQHRSQESVDFGAWQSGRHSPDAFASLAFGGR